MIKMVDSDRRQALRELTQLYRPDDYYPAVASMPTFIEDEQGEYFHEFFDFLQSLYLFQSEFLNYDAEEIYAIASSLLSMAQDFDFPTNQIEVFLDNA